MKKTKLSNSQNVLHLKKRRYAAGHWELFSMVLPAIIYVFVFCYIPMYGLVIAFKDYKYSLGIFGSDWVGFKNFEYIFGSNTLYTLVRNTLGYNLVFNVLGVVVPVFLALMLFTISKKWPIKIFQSSMFIPNFLSWIVVSYISYAFLKSEIGFINAFLIKMGWENISFYTEPKYWPLILTLFNVWKGAGYSTLMYYGAMLSISPELYEAAELDGCNYVKKHWYVTLPHIKGTIIILVILSIGSICRSDYGLFYYLPQNSGSLYPVTDVLDTYIMRAVTISGSLGQSSAFGFMQSIVGFILVITTNAVVKRIDPDNSLF